MALALVGAAGASAGTPPSSAEATPSGGPWLKDEQGREYYLDKVERSRAVRIDEHTARMHWGIPIEIASEDAEFFYYRVYRPAPEAAPAPAATPDTRAIESSYRVKLRATRKLRYEAFDAGLPRAGQWREGFSIADMNGDGRPDIVHGPARKTLRPPAIFLGDGRGGWKRWDAQWPALPYDYGDAQAADLDGDGHLDLALAVHLRGVFALLGDGKGTFRAATEGLDVPTPERPLPFSSHALAVTDWDGDGRADILALGEGPRLALGGDAPAPAQGIVLYRNEGGGRWSRKPGGPAALFGDAIEVADVDGDGRREILTGTNVLGLDTLRHSATPDGGWTSSRLEGVRPLANVRSLAPADLDGDGRVDLVVGYISFEGEVWRSGIDVLWNAASGWTRRGLYAATGKERAPVVAVGDLDADGRRDVVAGTADGTMLVYRNAGAREFTSELAPPKDVAGCAAAHVELADVDAQPGDEIVMSFSSESSGEEPSRCASEGGVRAWRVTSRPAAK